MSDEIREKRRQLNDEIRRERALRQSYVVSMNARVAEARESVIRRLTARDVFVRESRQRVAALQARVRATKEAK